MTSNKNSGFYQCPVSKGLLCSIWMSSFAINFPFHHYGHYLVYNHARIYDKVEFWRIMTSKLAFLNLKDLFMFSVLLYYFRIFERRYGSRKFSSYLLGTCALSSILELLVIYVCRQTDVSLETFPSGLHGVVFPLFVPYFFDIPRVAMTHIWGIPVTGKSITYIIGLQLTSDSPESFILAVCGIVAGLLYRNNFCMIQSVIGIPSFIAKLCSVTLGRIFSTAHTSCNLDHIGATLEVQRQQHLDQLEQQMAWSSLQNHRNMDIGRPQPMNMVQGGGIFGNMNFPNPLRHRQNATADNPTHTESETPNTEEQVQRLVEMGFNRDLVLHALESSNNDILRATNVLLQGGLQT